MPGWDDYGDWEGDLTLMSLENAILGIQGALAERIHMLTWGFGDNYQSLLTDPYRSLLFYGNVYMDFWEKFVYVRDRLLSEAVIDPSTLGTNPPSVFGSKEAFFLYLGETELSFQEDLLSSRYAHTWFKQQYNILNAITSISLAMQDRGDYRVYSSIGYPYGNSFEATYTEAREKAIEEYEKDGWIGYPEVFTSTSFVARSEISSRYFSDSGGTGYAAGVSKIGHNSLSFYMTDYFGYTSYDPSTVVYPSYDLKGWVTPTTTIPAFFSDATKIYDDCGTGYTEGMDEVAFDWKGINPYNFETFTSAVWSPTYPTAVPPATVDVAFSIGMNVQPSFLMITPAFKFRAPEEP